MTRSKLASCSIASVVCLAMIVPVITVASMPAAGNHASDGSRSYVAEQGDQCVALTPRGDGQTNVTEFYDYRVDPEYSSHGTEHLQRSQMSQVFLYHGSDGLSLVFLHDSRVDDVEGGSISMEITNLPEDGRWLVEDDDYRNGTDDSFEHDETVSRIDWMWGGGRTDGGAFRGLERLDAGERISMTSTWGEDSHGGQTGWPWAENDTYWRVRDGSGDLVPLDKDQPLEIGPGTCAETAPTANLTADPVSVTVDESVTLDASHSFDESRVVRYHWDFTGDGDVDENTSEPTLTHTYEVNATVTPTVTVEDDDGMTATDRTTVHVHDETPPSARASASPTNVSVGDPVEFNATESTDNARIAAYEWTFGDDATGDGENVTHTYESAGTYDATLTVTDGAGNQATDNVTIAVDAANETAPDSGENGTEDDPSENGTADDGTADDGANEGGGSDDGNTGDDGPSDDGPTDGGSNDGPDDGGQTDDSGQTDDEHSGDTGDQDSGGSGGAPAVDSGSETDEQSSSATAVRAENGSISVTVENAVEGRAVSATVPSGENESTTLQAITLVPTTDAERLNVTLSLARGGPAPNGTDATLLELTPQNGAPVERVTYQFAVDRTEVGHSTSRLRVLARTDSGSERVEHTVTENGSTTFVDATTDEFGPVVLATDRPDLSVRSLSVPSRPVAGEAVAIEATLANDEFGVANRTVTLTVDGSVVDSSTVSIPENSSATVSFETTFDSPGDRRIVVAGTERSVHAVTADSPATTTIDTADESEDDRSEPLTATDTMSPPSTQETQIAVVGFGLLFIAAAGFSRFL